MTNFGKLLLRAQAADSELDAFLEEPFLLDGAMETPEEAAIVQIAINACRAVQGTPGQLPVYPTAPMPANLPL